jgi:hypothetical protein
MFCEKSGGLISAALDFVFGGRKSKSLSVGRENVESGGEM